MLIEDEYKIRIYFKEVLSMYTHTHIHTHLYIYIYVCTCVGELTADLHPRRECTNKSFVGVNRRKVYLTTYSAKPRVLLYNATVKIGQALTMFIQNIYSIRCSFEHVRERKFETDARYSLPLSLSLSSRLFIHIPNIHREQECGAIFLGYDCIARTHEIRRET